MSNQAYLSVWLKGFSEEALLQLLGDFLATVPSSQTRPGFTRLITRAVNAAEAPVFEQDLRATPLDAAGILELATDRLQSDCSCEVESHWDLWTRDPDSGVWQLTPRPLEIFCNGPDYDEGVWRENGQVEVNFGFEHMFTGHAGLLGIRRAVAARPQALEEARFLASMAQPENLQTYQQKTQENIRKLFEWIRRIETSLPVDKIRLWSEGEENLEARLEEILAAR